MYGRRPFLLVVTAALAGCSLISDQSTSQTSSLSLTIQNDRSSPTDVTVTLTDAGDTVIDEETDRLAGSVGRTFEFTVTERGRYTVTVEGDDWKTEQTWDTETCASYTATVRFTDSSLENSAECVESR
ncbi:hypothetical protein [Haladaptatus sp. DJG-WS-42]|uniref:hypothetical protein n=1 Tax=Haladaptatus sp. DJG-WS-42 TaxID=3120516 RepID=UPI0030CD146E